MNLMNFMHDVNIAAFTGLTLIFLSASEQTQQSHVTIWWGCGLVVSV